MKKLVLITAMALSLFATSCSSDDAQVLSTPEQPEQPQPTVNNELIIHSQSINQLNVKRYYVDGTNDNTQDNNGQFKIYNADLLQEVIIRTVDGQNAVPVTMTLNTSNRAITLEGASKYKLTVKVNDQGVTVLGELQKVDNN